MILLSRESGYALMRESILKKGGFSYNVKKRRKASAAKRICDEAAIVEMRHSRSTDV